MNAITKRYLTTSYGQVHLRESIAATAAPPLWCLHATAYSGRTFEGVMKTLAGRRTTVAPDTPGYGASTRPPSPWTIEQYATALAEAIEVAGGGPVDLFGYHTGAFFATELAAQRPDLVRRLVLVGVPFFEGEARTAMLAKLGHTMTLTEDLEQFEERWSFFITNRAKGVPLEQGFAHFTDELIAYPYGFWAHDAAFKYAAEDRLPLVSQPVLTPNPDNHLSEPSRAASRAMANARVIEMPHLQHAVLDLAAEELAEMADRFLSEP